MRRKIIKQGNNSYTLTLPLNWIKENEIETIKEIQINEEENNLIISIPKETKKINNDKIKIDLKEYNERTIRNILNNIYRKGYDLILLKYKNKEQLKEIKKITRNTLLGFEITEFDESKIIIENITEPSVEKYENILRKIFIITKNETKDILEILESQNTNYDFEKRKEIKNMIDDYTNFTRRLIIKNKIGGHKDSYFNYSLSSRISLIHHSYFYMYKYIVENSLVIKNKATLELLKKTNEIYELLEKAIFTRNIDLAHEVANKKNELLNKTYKLLEITKGKENIILYHIGESIRLIHLTSNILFGISKLENTKY